MNADQDHGHRQDSRGSIFGIYAAMLLAACTSSAGITVIYNVLPTLQRAFPSQPALAWVVTIYWLASAIAAAVCGRMGDLKGRTQVMTVVLILAAVGAATAALSPSLPWLIAGCAVQGAASGITPLSFGIFRENLPAARVPVAVGVLTSAGTVCAGVRSQLSSPQPLIGLRLLADRQFALANICFVIIVLGTIQIGQILSLFFQQPSWTGTGLGLSATGSGLMHLLLDAFSILAAPWSGRIALRHGAKRAALVGFVMIAAAWAYLVLWHGDRTLTLAGAALALSGYAVTATALYNLIIESVPIERTGEATGLTYVLFTAFFAVGAQIIFALLAADRVVDATRAGLTFPSEAAFRLAFGYIAATGVLGFLLASRLPDRLQISPRRARHR